MDHLIFIDTVTSKDLGEKTCYGTGLREAIVNSVNTRT